MADSQNNVGRFATRVQPAEQIDAGLRAYMLRVYNYMALALAITGVAALANRALS